MHSGKQCQLDLPNNVRSPMEVIIIRETHRDNWHSSSDLDATRYWRGHTVQTVPSCLSERPKRMKWGKEGQRGCPCFETSVSLLTSLCIASSCISSNWAGTHGVRGHTLGTRLGLKAWETCRRLATYIIAAKSEKHRTHVPRTNKEFTFKPHGFCAAEWL